MEESRLKQEADAKKTTGDKMETDVNPGMFFVVDNLKLFIIMNFK